MRIRFHASRHRTARRVPAGFDGVTAGNLSEAGANPVCGGGVPLAGDATADAPRPSDGHSPLWLDSDAPICVDRSSADLALTAVRQAGPARIRECAARSSSQRFGLRHERHTAAPPGLEKTNHFQSRHLSTTVDKRHCTGFSGHRPLQDVLGARFRFAMRADQTPSVCRADRVDLGRENDLGKRARLQRVCHEKRNAGQCPPARRKPHRHH